MKKKLYVTFISLLLLSISYIFTFCTDGITGVEAIDSGLTGKVVDTFGNPINGVEVFCLYYSYQIPINPQGLLKNNSVEKMNDLYFELLQNYPNPFSSSTYIRYSLPQKCQIELQIIHKKSNRKVYSYSEELEYGYYQQYLKSIVDSLNLKNGIYTFTIKATGEDGTKYESQKELVVISDIGKPNAETVENGEFIFDFEDAFVGDSIVINKYDSEYYLYTEYLTSNVHLLFKKSGYQSEYITIELYSNVLLTHDIVMVEDE